jgi:hypothetical protein
MGCWQAAEKMQSAASAKKSRPFMYVQCTAHPGFFHFIAAHAF